MEDQIIYHILRMEQKGEVDLLASAFLPDHGAEANETVACVGQLLVGLEEAVWGHSAGVGKTGFEGVAALGRAARVEFRCVSVRFTTF